MANRRLRNWKRMLFKVVVFLLLGAIVNVAVAWGCATWVFREATGGQTTYLASPGEFHWAVWEGSCWRRFVVCTSFIRKPRWAPKTGPPEMTTPPADLIPPWSQLPRSAIEFEQRPLSHQLLKDDARGVPLICLHALTVLSPIDSKVLKIEGGLSTSLFIAAPGGAYKNRVVLPLVPIWPGFAINTIFYAAMLAMLFYGPGKVRRIVRVRRSKCPACGHIIAPGTCANGLCSECGSPLPKGFKPKPEVSTHT